MTASQIAEGDRQVAELSPGRPKIEAPESLVKNES
jgi:hypothetical protein